MSDLQLLIQKANEISAFDTKQKHVWCSGCGDYGIFQAMIRALVLEDVAPQDTLICFDVGCNGNGSDKIGAYTIHGLHGRVLPLSSGAAIANPNLKVLATAGDGATYSEGINHLVHAIRSDYPVTFIVHNNNNYGLTIGQASSTTKPGYSMAGSPQGVSALPLNTLQFVLSLKPSFVARSFSGDVGHMTEMIQAGMNHKGFSYVEIMQACPTFNKATPQEWYWDKLVYTRDLPGYENTDIWQARKLVDDMDEKIAVGVIYLDSNEDFFAKQPARKNQVTTLVEEVKKQSITRFVKEFV